jgi:hypothetical protein
VAALVRGDRLAGVAAGARVDLAGREPRTVEQHLRAQQARVSRGRPGAVDGLFGERRVRRGRRFRACRHSGCGQHAKRAGKHDGAHPAGGDLAGTGPRPRTGQADRKAHRTDSCRIGASILPARGARNA